MAAGSSEVAAIEYFIALGADPNAVQDSRDTARFQPKNSDELPFLRRCLLKLDWFDGYELLKCVRKAAALSSDQAAKLFKDQRLRFHLEKHLPALSRLFPVLKKFVGPKGNP
jgi:hypothetical protein